MIIIGLTGSIAMGKSTLAQQFAACGAAICDSDQLVHRLLAKGGKAVDVVATHFPSALAHDAIDRKALGREVFGNPRKLKILETLLHPLVRAMQQAFIRRARIRRKQFVVLDIPLLFETQGERMCDYTVVASSPFFLQRQRAMRRPHMTQEKFLAIWKQQMKNSEKIKCADFVVFTGMGKYNSLKAVKTIIKTIRERRHVHYAGTTAGYRNGARKNPGNPARGCAGA